jgi:hypothetical protein
VRIGPTPIHNCDNQTVHIAFGSADYVSGDLSSLRGEEKRHNPRTMMRWKATLAILVALSASIALADDFKTVDGKEYKNVKVSRVEPDGIVITHSAGVAKIPFKQLPKEMQERVGYDQAKIEAAEAAARAAETAARAAEEKRIEDQRAADRAVAQERAEKEQSAAANLKNAEEEFKTAEQRATETYKVSTRGTLSGQIFVATKGGENFKLGAVRVSLFSRDAMDILLAGLKAFADAKMGLLPFDAAKAAEQEAERAEQEAERAEQQAERAEQETEPRVEQAKATAESAQAKAQSDLEYYRRWGLSSNSARHAAEASRSAADGWKQAINDAKGAVIAAKRGVDEAKEAVNAAKEAVNAARRRYNDLLYQKDFYYSADFYFSYLQSLEPIQTAETDGDGKFAMEIPRTGVFVIAAQGERNVAGQATERYHWLQPVSLEGEQQHTQNLSNSNLTRTTGTSSLVLTED